MNKLSDKLKKFYKIHNDLEKMNKEYDNLKQDIEELIIDNNLIDKKFSLGNLIITYKQIDTTQTLTQQYISNCLEKYFSKKPHEAEALLNYILDNRTKKSKYSLNIKKNLVKSKV